MSFNRMKHSVVNACVRIPLMYRYCMTIVIVLMIFFFWYYCVRSYIQYTLMQKESEYQQLQNSYISTQRALSEFDLLLHQTHGLLYQTQQIQQMSYDDVLFSIIGASEKHSLICTQYMHDKKIEREWYAKKQISFKMHGSLKNI